jgi:RimJ/RimL family protein N-acetyltransferase
MGQRGRQLVDGFGRERVIAKLLETPVLLRKVREADCRLLWEWRTEPEVQAASFSSEPIPWERHVEWFRAKLDDPQSRLYLVTDADGAPIGQVRFDLEGQAGVMSVSLARASRGKGLGRQVIRLAAERAFAAAGLDVIHAYIKHENDASLRAFGHAGFRSLGDTVVRGQRACHFVLERAGVAA